MLNRSNRSFNDLLKTFKAKTENINITSELYHLLNGNLIEIDDCIYYESLAPRGVHSLEHTDRTGNEAFYNKIQIDDYCEYKSIEEQVILGIEFAKCLAEKLNVQYKEPFKVILSCDDDFCNITFHKMRLSEEYLMDNLEDYQLDSILEITTN